ncbi:DUF5787 family protein [Natronomonas salsuginis]|uniref:Uncharacterized protein n=1 Tax=Natronomonas salsuginis TaxID=2217661 RepID=A0A4U5J6Z8_9EURY|nr:DUF5787 family protein [Natronomonas salsuginis]TKR24800.1 hypothetical protein DM868_12740 [Natronomonas salsuginis]
MKEFGFELRVCAWAERNWPHGGRTSTAIVARQLGTRRRRWDTLVIETTDADLRGREPFGEDRLDSDLLHVARHAPASWTYYRECLPDPGYPWRYVREAIHRADDRGFVETRRDGNRIEIRRRYRYPAWAGRIVAIENKPDLDASAARRLAEQLEHDVALALADEIWVATTATDEEIEPALLEAMPVEVGILSVSNERGSWDCEPIWQPRTLDVSAPGTRILDRSAGGPRDMSAARFEYADPGWKHRKRLEIAERAYERGWRSYAATMRPDCRHFELEDPTGPFPWCAAKQREQTAAECSGSCADFEPEPPAWRSMGWPIEGGPGRATKRLLDRKRQRRR